MGDRPHLACAVPHTASRCALAAFADLFNSKTVHVLKCLMDNEMFVIMALHLELKAQGAERVLMDRVHRKVN